MILYRKDWHKYPNAIIDLETKNASFIKLAAILKKAGVKNNAFMLVLHQKELQGVDPYDPNLTVEQMTMIRTECEYNPWYYFREVARLPQPGSPKPSMFLANRANISMFWCFFNSIDYASILPRQNGKSVAADTLNTYLMNVGAKNTTIQLVTKDNKLRAVNIKRLKAIRELLPKYLYVITRDDTDNTEELTNLSLDNFYKTAVGQKSVETAENTGRGFTAPILQCDEGPYIPNIHISLPVAMSAGSRARDIAKQNGTYYGNIITTTAGKRDTEEGKYMYALINNGMAWDDTAYDTLGKDALDAMVLANATAYDDLGNKRLLVNGTFNHRQLGRTDEWLREAIVNSGANMDMVLRDFFNVWSSGSETSPLSNELNNVISRAVIEPSYREVSKDQYIMRWYVPQEQIHSRMSMGHFIISLDSSNSVGKDANGINIIDIRSMEVVASAAISEANIQLFATWVGELLLRFPNTTLMVENKSTGQSIMDTVALLLINNGHCPFKRMFNRVFQLPEEHRSAIADIDGYQGRPDESLYLRHRRHFGFMTTGQTRQTLYSTILQAAAKSAGHKVNDELLSKQIRGLITKNGRVDHPVGGHDDLVISWLMAHWMASMGSNLQRYGIPSSAPLSLVSPEGAVLTKAEMQEKQMQAELKLNIEALSLQLQKAKDKMIIYKLETQLRKLTAKLPEEEALTTFNEILEQARQGRKKSTGLRDKLVKGGYLKGVS